jgi:hypothetical protein
MADIVYLLMLKSALEFDRERRQSRPDISGRADPPRA